MNTVCIAFLNSKGGVGKTTSAVNTAAALAELGHRVLLLDMDAQSHVASHLGLDVDPRRSIDAVLMEKHGQIRSAIQSSQYPRLDVVLSTPNLEEVERLLILRNQPVDALWRALVGLGNYDFVLIDWRVGQMNGWVMAAAWTYRSLIASCILHGINPELYMEELLRLAPHWPKPRILELAPKYWLRTRERLDERQRSIITRPWESAPAHASDLLVAPARDAPPAARGSAA